jgi:hypothetical protein
MTGRFRRATVTRADAALTDEPTFGVEEAIKRLAELSPDARALALTKLSLAVRIAIIDRV